MKSPDKNQALASEESTQNPPSADKGEAIKINGSGEINISNLPVSLTIPGENACMIGVTSTRKNKDTIDTTERNDNPADRATMTDAKPEG